MTKASHKISLSMQPRLSQHLLLAGSMALPPCTQPYNGCSRNLVAVRILSEGTNLGAFNGVIPPTGKHFVARQSHWFRIADNQLAEHWATREDLVAMLQLGILQPPGGPIS